MSDMDADNDVEMKTDANLTTELHSKPQLFPGEDSTAGAADHNHASGATNENLPWVEKYRPSSLGELISHTDILNTISRLLASGQLPHLLFYGPPGTGKTSTILALARQLHGTNFSSLILELNASDDRGIDVVREQIKNFASSRQLFQGGLKLIILDEADAMTRTAQFALRRVIEKYTKNTRFCLICNYINKIIPALQSRCTRFRFAPLDSAQIETRLQVVCDKEKVNIDPSGMRAVIKLADGDMRKCLNVLQACHLAYPMVNEHNVYLCTGNPQPADIESMLTMLLNKNTKEAYQGILTLQTEKGLSLADIITYLHETLLRLSLPPAILAMLLDELGHLEVRLSHGLNERVQLAGLVGTFQLAKEALTKQAQA